MEAKMRQAHNPTQCPFCNPDELSTRLVAKWKGVRLISDAHPIVFGHLLGVADEHCLSFGELDINALQSVKAKVIETARLLSGIKPKVILFERGNMSENISGKPSVDHAHFHLIPTEDIVSLLPTTKRAANFMDLPRYIANSSYYFYWDIFDDMAYWGDSKEVSSQFIRRIVSSANGLLDWDWRRSTAENCNIEKHSSSVRAILERK